MKSMRGGCALLCAVFLTMTTARGQGPTKQDGVQAPPDKQVSLVLGPVTLTTYNPVTITTLESHSYVYFLAKNQGPKPVTLQLTAWDQTLSTAPGWIYFLFKFLGSDREPPTSVTLAAGETRTLEFFVSKDLNYGAAGQTNWGPTQQCQLPFHFSVLETGDQSTFTLSVVVQDSSGDFNTSFYSLTSATITGRVTSASQQPVPGAEVTIARFNLRGSVRTWTDADGHYRLNVLSMDDVKTELGPRPYPYAMEYYLTAEAGGHGLAYVKGLAPTTGQTIVADVTLPDAPGLESDLLYLFDDPAQQPAPQTSTLYKLVGELPTNGLLSYWRLRFAGNGDRVVAIQGQHPPSPAVPGHIIAVDLSGKELWRVPTGDECWGLDVSSDGSLVAAGCYDQFAYIVSSVDGRVLQKVRVGDRPGGGWVMDVRFSPDGKYLMTDGGGVLDVQTGRTLWKAMGVYQGRWSPDGKRLVMGSNGPIAMFTAAGTRVWEAWMGESPLWLEVDGAYNVYAAGKSRTLFAWDKDGNLRWRYPLSNTSNEAAHGMTADGSFMVTPGFDGLLQAFNAQGVVLWQHALPIQMPGMCAGPGHNALSMTPTGSLIAVGDRCYELMLYDRNGTLLWRNQQAMRADFRGDDPVTHGGYKGTNSVDISPDGNYIAAGYADSVIRIFRRQPGGPSTTSAGVVSAASYAATTTNGISPGEMLTLFGQGMGPAQLAPLQLDSAGKVSTLLAGTQVLFDNTPAPILYTSSGQASVIAPYDLAGKSRVTITVQYQGLSSPPIEVPVVSANPALFTLDSSGKGDAAILHADSSPVNAGSPAAAGETVILFAEGYGVATPALPDGTIVASTLPKPVGDTVLLIDGQPVDTLYCGSAPSEVNGVLQINFRVPALASGAHQIQLQVGDRKSPPGVTMRVR